MPDLVDLAGQVFGRWTVVRRDGRAWICRCECGRIGRALGGDLKSGRTKSCGCSKFIDLTGQQFGQWTVLGPGPRTGPDKRPTSICRCTCGRTVQVSNARLQSGSRGCKACQVAKLIERQRTHGAAGHGNVTAEYHAWQSMMNRCYNPKHRAYPRYGGRGIRVCDPWRGVGGFEQFLADMGPRPPGRHGRRSMYTLDRIDVNGMYEPSNCRWATWSVQACNTRRPAYALAGRRFGRLLVLALVAVENNQAIYQVQCDCGTVKNVFGTALVGGGTKSCGCWAVEKARQQAIAQPRVRDPHTGRFQSGSPPGRRPPFA
jgi:hypothetical protein